MIKVLHLLSDSKFADIHIARFADPSFDNRFVFLGSEFNNTVTHSPLLEWVVPFSASFDALKQAVPGFDLVFVYNLDYVKSCFINDLPDGVLVCWHLYGTELYNNYEPFRHSIYSEVTRKILKINRFTRLVRQCKRRLGRIKYFVLHKRPDYEEMQRAITRINYLAWYSKNEYDFLQAGLPFRLPPFLPLNVLVKEAPGFNAMQTRSGGIWLGNSASPENNHVEMLTLFQNASFKEPVMVPFSYGGHTHYTRFIREFRKRSHLTITLLESFADLNVFSHMLAGCRAAVFNSYRQMALGTIFLALKYGVKVYLNELNPSFSWLKSNGFCLFSVGDDLVKDLKNNQLSLLPEEIKQNQAAYHTLVSPGNNRLFLEQIIELVNAPKK